MSSNSSDYLRPEVQPEVAESGLRAQFKLQLYFSSRPVAYTHLHTPTRAYTPLLLQHNSHGVNDRTECGQRSNSVLDRVKAGLHSESAVFAVGNTALFAIFHLDASPNRSRRRLDTGQASCHPGEHCSRAYIYS